MTVAATRAPVTLRPASRVARAKPEHERVRHFLIGCFALNIAIVIGLFASTEQFEYWGSSAHVWSSLGSLAGLLAANLVLVELLLMGRSRWMARNIDLERIVKWHRVLGHSAFDLLLVHVVLITIGYAQTADTGIWAEIKELTFDTRDMLMAVLAFGFMVTVVVSSIRIARRRLRHETWHFIHVYAYLAVALSLPHQIFVGSHFADSKASIAYWTAIYSVSVGTLFIQRIVRPMLMVLHHDLRVEKIVEETEDTVSIYIRGRDLNSLQARAGQYFVWRFLCRGQWWQAHPYSLSSAPNERRLRITVKALGDGSATLRTLKTGTRITAEGPYGSLTPERRRFRRVVLIAGGVGITPMRALAESFSVRPGELTIIYRAHGRGDLLFHNELLTLTDKTKARLQFVVGPREDFPSNMQPLSAAHLAGVAPDLNRSDVFVCGPPAMINQVLESLGQLSIDETQIHIERFESV